jgi:hydroxypyruvate reductase 1
MFWLLSVLQGKIKGYPVWGDPNQVAPFLNENAPPPAASPSIVNAKALGNAKDLDNCLPSQSPVSTFEASLDLVILLLPQVYLFQSYKSWKADHHLGALWFIMCVFLNIGSWSLL